MEPKVCLIMSGNLYMRQMRFENVGDVEHGHCHVFDHITLLATGSLKIRAQGQETVFQAPAAIKILANEIHELEAVEANTLAYCVHALRDAVTEEVLPDSMQHTDALTNPFSKDGSTVYVKPSAQQSLVNGCPVSLAPIAKLEGKITAETFNRNFDNEKPLVVYTSVGDKESPSFV